MSRQFSEDLEVFKQLKHVADLLYFRKKILIILKCFECVNNQDFFDLAEKQFLRF